MEEPVRTAPSPPMLRARGVDKHYPGGVVALDGAGIEVAAGEALALVGKSGSGKSTLLGVFNRTVAPDAGEISVDGRPVAERDPAELRRRIGYVPQNGGLIPHWTDTTLILSGALPAALLAVAVDLALGRLERAVRPRGLEAS